ncbi:RecB family exonuclease [Patescibacteria group bacterium]
MSNNDVCFGKSIHQTLKDFYSLVQKRMKPDLFTKGSQGKNIASLEELLDLYEHNWIDEWYDSAAHMDSRKAEGEKLLKAFYQKHKDSLHAPKFLEQPFNIKIGEYTLKGVIDRVDVIKKGKGGDDVEIIDYKTGKVPKSRKDVDLEQLILYAIASKEVFGDDPKKLTYHYLSESQEFSYEPSTEEIKKVKDRVKKTVREIKDSNFAATPSVYTCRSCDFKDICEFRIL